MNVPREYAASENKKGCFTEAESDEVEDSRGEVILSHESVKITRTRRYVPRSYKQIMKHRSPLQQSKLGLMSASTGRLRDQNLSL